MSSRNDSRAGRQIHSGIVMAALVLAAFLMVLVVYGYPRLFPYIAAQDPENYAQNVAQALVAGDIDWAVRIARFAAENLKTDPAAQTAYGQALLEAGRKGPAKQAFQSAVSIAVTPYPSSRPTRKPYYDTEARIALAELALEDGDEALGLHQLELARGYDPFNPRMPASRPAFDLYVRHAAWNRALDFDSPDPEELKALDADQCAGLARAAAYRGHWDYAARVMETASERGEHEAAAMMMGRLRAHVGDTDEARRWFEQAGTAEGAAYWLGLAQETLGEPEAAHASWRREPKGSLFHPFAAAKLAESGTDDGDAALDEAVDAVAWIFLVQQPKTFTGRRERPSHIAISNDLSAYGDVFPVLLRWDSSGDPTAGDRLQLQGTPDSPILRWRDQLVELVWITNVAPLIPAVGTQASSKAPIPGWTNPVGDWNSEGAEAVSELASSGENESCLRLIANTGGPSRLFSPPLLTTPGASYMLLAHTAGSGGEVSWRFLTRYEEPDTGGLVGPVPGWAGACTSAIWEWEALRIELRIEPSDAEMCVDSLVLAQIPERADAAPN